MNIFEVSGYKDFLKFKAEETRGNLTLLAKISKCQASYLLRIIHEEAHLTPDQVYRLCDYWGFHAEERDYFMTMVNLERSADANYKAHLKKELNNLLKTHNNLKGVMKREAVSDIQALLEYHSDWRISLIHFLSACSKFHSKDQLALRAKLGPSDLEEILNFLQAHNLIQFEGRAIKFKAGIGHIPRDSPVLPIFLGNWRQIGVQKSMKQNEQSVHFSNIQTIGKADIQKIVDLAKNFIQRSKKICDESSSEDVVAVNLDVFVP